MHMRKKFSIKKTIDSADIKVNIGVNIVCVFIFRFRLVIGYFYAILSITNKGVKRHMHVLADFYICSSLPKHTYKLTLLGTGYNK